MEFSGGNRIAAINSPCAFVTDASFDRSFDGPLPPAYQEKIPPDCYQEAHIR
jgi:hypothetical protein